MQHALKFIADYLPWLMSAVTIAAIELQGRKWPQAWLLSLAGQLLWFTWIAASRSWGFLPMTSVLCFQYACNHLRWAREARGGGGKPSSGPQGARSPGTEGFLSAYRRTGSWRG